MNHIFDTEIATKYGMAEAILIANFQFWIAKNKANGTHNHDGRTWTYNSVEAYGLLFPYLTKHQIRRALESLVERGVLVTGNYNSSRVDRTKWYAFFDECIFIDAQMHLANPTNANGTGAKTVNRTDVNPTGKPNRKPDADGADEDSDDDGRATRLPSTWVLPKAWGNWALDQFGKDGWDAFYVRQVADKFKDHYRSLPGDKGLRAGWDGVWRNWCRNELSTKGRPGATSQAAPWFASESGILAKGLELNMKPAPNEPTPMFKLRIDAAIENGGTPPVPRVSRADQQSPPPAPEGSKKRFKRGELAKSVADAVAGKKPQDPEQSEPNPESET